MKSILDQQRVLVLNAGWIPIEVKSVREALSMMCSDAAVAIHYEDGYFQTFKWKEWVTLPLKADDLFISTPHSQVKVPKIVQAINCSKVVTKTVPMTMHNLLKKYGFRDCYTLEPLDIKDASKEHVIPKSKGGGSGWDNILPAHKRTNNARGDKSHKEFGMAPKFKPTAPKPLPAAAFIENRYGIPEWDMFLKKVRVG